MYYVENKKVKLIDPTQFELSPRTVLGEISKGDYVLIKDRKSRIIMKDGQQIFEIIQSIQKLMKNIKVGLATNAPVCGKTTKYLKEKGIPIYQLKK